MQSERSSKANLVSVAVATLAFLWILLTMVSGVIYLNQANQLMVDAENSDRTEEELEEVRDIVNRARITLVLIVLFSICTGAACVLVFRGVPYSIWMVVVGLGVITIAFQYYSPLDQEIASLRGFLSSNRIEFFLVSSGAYCTGVSVIGGLVSLIARARPRTEPIKAEEPEEEDSKIRIFAP